VGDEEESELGDFVADESVESPYESAQENLQREDVQRALDALPDEYRMVVILADLEDFSYQEIADMLGIPIGTAKSRLHRSLGAMRSALAIEEVASAPSPALGGRAT
jgi:RNA polymerase sigma-70 factor (ECF subfamily)